MTDFTWAPRRLESANEDPVLSQKWPEEEVFAKPTITEKNKTTFLIMIKSTKLKAMPEGFSAITRSDL